MYGSERGSCQIPELERGRKGEGEKGRGRKGEGEKGSGEEAPEGKDAPEKEPSEGKTSGRARRRDGETGEEKGTNLPNDYRPTPRPRAYALMSEFQRCSDTAEGCFVSFFCHGHTNKNMCLCLHIHEQIDADVHMDIDR